MQWGKNFTCWLFLRKSRDPRPAPATDSYKVFQQTMKYEPGENKYSCHSEHPQDDEKPEETNSREMSLVLLKQEEQHAQQQNQLQVEPMGLQLLWFPVFPGIR